MRLLVRRAGFLSSVQDLGRTGWREAGVAVGGALDAHALRVANALVGNDDTAAGLELGLGRIELAVEDRRVIAWCGDGFAVEVAGRKCAPGHSVFVESGETIMLVAGENGARAWLAISGGIDVPLVMGSRSTDLRAQFGGLDGRALRDGDTLPLGACSPRAERIARTLWGSRISDWSALSHWVRRSAPPTFLRVLRGADWLRFSPEARAEFIGSAFTVTTEADRMGARLSGAELRMSDMGDRLSEAISPGTIQVPPDGQPILLLNDCQTLGGYPKIAHVISVDQNAAARLQPGDSVSFHEVTIEKAHELLRKREHDFVIFRAGMALRGG